MKFTSENLQDIALIFEQSNGNTLDANDINIINNSGFNEYKISEIENMLVNSLVAEKSVSLRGSIYWALGKRFNKKLIPNFRSWLKNEIELKEAGALYQLMIALDNLEEPIFDIDRDGSYSSLDKDLNLRDAKKYIEKYA